MDLLPIERLMQTMAKPMLSPEDWIDKSEARQLIYEKIQLLPPREALVLQLRFGLTGNEHTLKSVGEIIKVTKERVRQIELKALRRLRCWLSQADGRPQYRGGRLSIGKSAKDNLPVPDNSRKWKH